ncbi:hypothetical protein J4Q44_G00185150 [Coregonus suidteri]|uniref:Uncharacterized protein n=1 Tax=Coregonus suidteri TaxID=861788 RepID=A0AAN8QP24_9TELE
MRWLEAARSPAITQLSHLRGSGWACCRGIHFENGFCLTALKRLLNSQLASVEFALSNNKFLYNKKINISSILND